MGRRNSTNGSADNYFFATHDAEEENGRKGSCAGEREDIERSKSSTATTCVE